MAPFFLVFSKKSVDQLSLEQNFSFSLEGGGGGVLVLCHNFFGPCYLIFLDPPLHSGDMWVEFVVNFHLPLRVFLCALTFSFLPKNQLF